MARRRLGVVLLVPPPIDREIDGLRRAVGDGALGRVPPHLTLVPPVNINDDHLGEALALLRSAAAVTRPMTVELGPPATFLPDTPVLHLPAMGPGSDAVHALRDRVFTSPLARPMTWPFVPHVTLADESSPAQIEAALASLAAYRVEVTFERVHLLEEQRDGSARVWRSIADATFCAPAVIGRGGLELELSVTDRPDLEAAAFAEGAWEAHGRELWGAEYASDEPLAVTARRDGRVVGVAEGRTRGLEAYLARLVVAPAVRGEGVGAHLLAAFHTQAVERGSSHVALRTLAGGAAEAFYRRHGYVARNALPAWRHGRDFVVLRRDLG